MKNLKKKFDVKIVRLLIGLLFLIVVFSVDSANGKQILRATTVLDDEHVDHGKIVREERSEEKINMSYPGELRYVSNCIKFNSL